MTYRLQLVELNVHVVSYNLSRLKESGVYRF